MKSLFWKPLAFVLSAYSLVPSVLARVPYDPSPFDIIGTITEDGMKLDAPTTGQNPLLRGGTLSVDGITVTIPRNMIVALPSIAVAWPEMFDSSGKASLPGSVSWEAHVQGNRVGGKNIAGLVYITQKSAQVLQGFISSINTATGHFTIGANNIDCVINDPVGRFGLATTGNELWATDPDNPSIRAVNGFPVCFPRSASDKLCPSKNRPKDGAGKPVTIFTFKDPKTITPTDPDPFQMVPLAVGDFVDVSGVEIGGTLWVNNLVANLGIFTAPGTKPAYVTVEEVLYGVVTTQPGEVGETRAVVFTTDVGGAALNWFAIDVDPCTGESTERPISIPMQPNGVAPLGRAVFRGGKQDFSPPPRAVGFRLASGTVTGAGGITAGQFIQPIFDYTFPELLIIGHPMLTLSFESIPYLVKGSGPYVPGKFGLTAPTTPVIIGQLNPWPGAVAPAGINCPPPSTGPSPTDPPPPPPPPPPPANPPKDTIKIVSATGQNQKGRAILSVVATSSSKDPALVLNITAAGQNPVPLTPMTLVSPGQWSFQIQLKNKPTSVTVTSNFGGGPVTANVA